jgi:hypothetical protein
MKKEKKIKKNIINKFKNDFVILLEEIQDCYHKGEKELLEKEKIEKCEDLIRVKLGEIISKIGDEELSLKLEKLYSGYYYKLKIGFHDKKIAEERLGNQKIFIEDILNNSFGTVLSNEEYFSSGQTFDAVKALREILKSAKIKIWIEDNFLHPDTISIIEPYITGGISEIKFLTRSQGNRNFKSFQVDLRRLKSQYQDSNIEARENYKCHDRYIIIDEQDIYHSGHSFHELGKRASQVNKVKEESNRNEILSDFKDWWNNGNTICF